MTLDQNLKKLPCNMQPKWVVNLNELTEGLIKIQRKENSELSFQRLFEIVYNIVREGHYKALYARSQEIIKINMNKKKTEICEKIGEVKLNYIVTEWNDHLLCSIIFQDVLSYLDQLQEYYSNYNDMIYNTSITIFRNEVIHDKQIFSYIQDVLLEMVLAERKGQVIDHTIFKSVINMLIALNITDELKMSDYRDIFETPFLQQSVIFYKQEAKDLLEEPGDAIHYLDNFEVRIMEEKERVSKLLHSSSEPKIINVLDECLMKEHLDKILELKHGIRFMLTNSCRKQLNLLYEYNKKYGTHSKFLNDIAKVFYEIGISFVDRKDINVKDHYKVVESIVKLKEKYEDFGETCFQNEDSFKQSIQDNFLLVFNYNPQMAEFLAAYIHFILKENYKNDSEEKLNIDLEHVMKLFKNLCDKDVFERFYKLHLGKRLLSARPNLEVEKLMVGKLKVETGSLFTANLEAMIHDITVSENHLDLFIQKSAYNNDSFNEIDFGITILQKGAWSLSQFPECILPYEPKNVYEKFTKFYKDEHSGRKLNLQYNLGTATLKVYYDASNTDPKLKKRSFQFDCSTLQMIVLSLFNNDDRLTIEEIQLKTNIPEKHLISCLSPMVLGKPTLRVLKRINPIKDGKLNKDDILVINENYNSRSQRIKIPFNTINDDDQLERQRLKDRTRRERDIEIQAAVVRAIKSRNILKKTELTMETINLLKHRFKPDVPAIERQFKLLEDKEYIKKQENDPNTYVYIT